MAQDQESVSRVRATCEKEVERRIPSCVVLLEEAVLGGHTKLLHNEVHLGENQTAEATASGGGPQAMQVWSVGKPQQPTGLRRSVGELEVVDALPSVRVSVIRR